LLHDALPIYFNVTWNHGQRQEANPGTSFSASVNFGTSSYFRNTGFNQQNSIEDLTRNNMSSSIAYGKVFADGKVNFTANMSHRQDMARSEEHTSELQSRENLVCRRLLEKKKNS